MVRSLQSDRAGPGRSRQTVLRQAESGQSQRRREPGDPQEVRHPRHTDADAVQERQRGGAEGGGFVKVPADRIS